jgi:hypothetical protein
MGKRSSTNILHIFKYQMCETMGQFSTVPPPPTNWIRGVHVFGRIRYKRLSSICYRTTRPAAPCFHRQVQNMIYFKAAIDRVSSSLGNTHTDARRVHPFRQSFGPWLRFRKAAPFARHVPA